MITPGEVWVKGDTKVLDRINPVDGITLTNEGVDFRHFRFSQKTFGTKTIKKFVFLQLKT